MTKKENNNSYAYIAIVAIVAVVALVFLFSGKTNLNTNENMGGNAIMSSSEAVFTESQGIDADGNVIYVEDKNGILIAGKGYNFVERPDGSLGITGDGDNVMLLPNDWGWQCECSGSCGTSGCQWVSYGGGSAQKDCLKKPNDESCSGDNCNCAKVWYWPWETGSNSNLGR